MNENEKQKIRFDAKMEARRLGLTPVTTYSVHGNVLETVPVKGAEVSAKAADKADAAEADKPPAKAETKAADKPPAKS